MIKLNEIVEFNDLLEVCLKGITGNNSLLSRLQVVQSKAKNLDQEYRSKALDGRLYELKPLKCFNTRKHKRIKKINSLRVYKNTKFKRTKNKFNPIIYENINRLEFIKLYEQYFVNKEKIEARTIYDQILASAKQKCPYCSGVGRPRNLDHYLPKAHFPKYSILPINLVPCCRDCNMDAKADQIIHKYTDQLLHPYLDKSYFFNEQWIHVEFKSTVLDETTNFFYIVKAPESWSERDKTRVNNHFKACNLGVRFSKDAVDSFINITWQIKEFRELGVEDKIIIDCLLKPYLNHINRNVNHWERVLVKGIIDTFFV